MKYADFFSMHPRLICLSYCRAQTHNSYTYIHIYIKRTEMVPVCNVGKCMTDDSVVVNIVGGCKWNGRGNVVIFPSS